MKNRLFLIAVICIVTTIHALAEKVRGTIILQNDSSFDVTFQIPLGLFSREVNFQKLQNGVKFYDQQGKKQRLRANAAKEFQFVYLNKKIRMVSVKGDLQVGLFSSGPHMFLKLEIDGACRLFTYHFTRQSGGMYMGGSYSPTTNYSVEKFVLQKGKSGLFMPVGISFRRDMREFFADCPVIVKKIQEKELRKRDLEQIVYEYNQQCGSISSEEIKEF